MVKKNCMKEKLLKIMKINMIISIVYIIFNFIVNYLNIFS